MTIACSQFIWNEPTGLGRNLFLLFQRKLELGQAPEKAELQLFADSLYRLQVNGIVVGTGPARFLPSHPEFDTFDIAPYLRAGSNRILVVVNSRGCSSYQGVPSRGGFVAGGAIADGEHTHSLATPGDWQVLRSDAWDAWAEPFSFAQGPIEVCDLRKLPDSATGLDALDWQVPVLAEPQAHWGPLAPRSIAYPSRREIHPGLIKMIAPIRHTTLRYSFKSKLEFGKDYTPRSRQPFFTHLFSPTEQEVTLGVFWGPVYLNGTELKHENDPLHGDRQIARASLRQGWNLLVGMPEMLQSCWPFLIEIPDGLGLELCGLPGQDAEIAFYLGPVLEHEAYRKWVEGKQPEKATELGGFPALWKPTASLPYSPSPSRDLSWDDVNSNHKQNLRHLGAITLPIGESSGAATAVFDFQREYLGHIRIVVEAPAGTVIDIGYDERLRGDGAIGYFATHWGVNTADRFVLSGGKQTLETYHERGGRYLQVTARDSSGPVILHGVGVIQRVGDHPVVGSFECADPVLNWTWKTGIETLRSSMSDGWIDPWRERGLYLGDAKVETHATRMFTNDYRLERWAIRLYAHGQFANDQIPDVVPSHHFHALSDYTLIWIHILRDFWAATGELSLVKELWPMVERILHSPHWKRGPMDLWETPDDTMVFIDWGTTQEARLGVNAVLNAFRIRALDYAGEMCAALGRMDESATWLAEAARVRDAYQAFFWLPEKKRYAACWHQDKLSITPALHANVLALAYGITTPQQTPGVLGYVKDGLAHNLVLTTGHIELYFFYFTLAALYRHGETALAEQIVRTHYGKMYDAGAWGFWETLARGHVAAGSHCHGWATGPMVYFMEKVLGVGLARPGDPSHVLIAPESESLNWARGVYPHPQGLVAVDWKVNGTVLTVEVTAPKEVRVTIAPKGRLAELRRVESIQTASA
ncbi:MAG: family 78 glycoside hydrolase catalytic domain [Verrucomicrobiota bacterium]|nr:family 78 glycoside hydrolase catalytic domain [Verrucomicrobiota bacterium]